MGAQLAGPVCSGWAHIRIGVSDTLLPTRPALAPKWYRTIHHAQAVALSQPCGSHTLAARICPGEGMGVRARHRG